MIHHCRCLFFTFLMCLPISGYTASPPQTLASQVLAPFQTVQVFKGQFEQQKTLPVLANPFISSGSFLSIKGQGLLWKTENPSPSTLLMTPGQVVQTTNGHKQTFSATGSGFDGFAILLPALLDGDMATLNRYFSVSEAGTPEQWTLTLTPSNRELSSILSSVSVSGEKKRLTRITLNSPDGDVTRIAFQSITMSNEAPNAAELAYFNQSR